METPLFGLDKIECTIANRDENEFVMIVFPDAIIVLMPSPERQCLTCDADEQRKIIINKQHNMSIVQTEAGFRYSKM